MVNGTCKRMHLAIFQVIYLADAVSLFIIMMRNQ